MKFIAGLIVIALTTPAHAKLPKTDWVLGSGKLIYHVSFPLKKIEGATENVKGKGHCENGQCQFLVAAPVVSFKSGDGNRDNHMLEVTKAGTNPMVIVKVQFPESNTPAAIDAKVEVSFAGKTHTYEHIKLNPKIDGGKAKVSGKLPILLSDYAVERPSLLGVEIDDSVPVEFELNWN